jgi:hypothetical protein
VTTASPAQVMAYLLKGLGVAPTTPAASAWPTYVGTRPTLPDNVIVLYDTSGTSDSRNARTDDHDTHDGVQIVVRSKADNYEAGWNKIRAIHNALCGVQNVTVTLPGPVTVMVHMVHVTSLPIKFGQEEQNNRPLFSLNVTIPIS